MVAVATTCEWTAGVQAGFVATGVWQATVTLSTFPCASDPTCGGTLTGSLVGTATGLDPRGHPFVVIWPDPTAPMPPASPLALTLPPPNLSATFLFTQSCPGGVSDAATGNFTLLGGYADDNGVISHDGTMTGIIGWTRYGVLLVVGTSGGVLTAGGSTLATQQTIGEGVGVFVPEGVAICAVPSFTAQVVGSYATPQ